jgi:putative ABC transport system permease protein
MDLARDVRLVFRHLLRAPGYISAVILTLALAIGANSAVFGAVYAVLLNPLPIRQPNHLVICWETDARAGKRVIEISYRNFRAWATESRSFAQAAAMGSSTWPIVLDVDGNATRVAYAAVTASFFDTLGVGPLYGRTFRAEDDVPSAPPVAILSYGNWVRRFGANAGIVGTMIRLDGTPHLVVGIMPRDFDFPRGAELWAPVVPDLAAASDKWGHDVLTDVGVLYVVGRLREGVTPAMAAAELDRLARLPEGSAPGAPQFGAAVTVTSFLDYVLGAVRPALWAFLAAGSVLLLIACANVSGLVLTRVTRRDREHAIRVALGATRARLGRLWALEITILSLAGGVLGLAASRWLSAAIVALAPDDVPRLAEVTVDGRVAAFACAVVVVVALLCSAAPVIRLRRAMPLDALRLSAHGAGPLQWYRGRSMLVVLQISLAIVLLVTTGLVVRSFTALRRLNLGFRPSGVLTMNVTPRAATPSPNEWMRDLIARLAAVPNVDAVGAVSLRPLALGPIGEDTWVILEGQADTRAAAREHPLLNHEVATPGYFAAMGIELKRGRVFTDQDTAATPKVAIVGEATALRLWPGQDPIGKRLSMPTFTPDGPSSAWRTVIGVVADVRYRGLDDPRPDVYDAARQWSVPADNLVVHTSTDPLRLVAPVQAQARQLEPQVIIDHVTTMDTVVSRAVAPWRFSVWILTVFATVAFALAAVGLFSVVSLDVARRQQEFAVRLALGAKRRDLVRSALRPTVGRVLAGAALGVSVSLAGAEAIRSLLFGVEPKDALTYLAVIGLVTSVVGLASYLPARRTAGIDPLALLRRD